MKLKSAVALLLSLIVLASLCACSAKSQSAKYDAAPMEQMAEAPAAAAEMSGMSTNYAADTSASSPAAAQENLGPRKIVYNADMSLTVDDPAAALAELIDRNTALGGYLSTSYTRTDELGAYRCTVELKVPADRLEELVNAAKTVGKVDSYQLSSDDITLSYYDIEARLSAAKAEEAQLLTVLRQCETVEDILLVRAQLGDVRADIESYQGQINLWDNLVAYATLFVSISRTQRAAVETENELIAIWKASDVWKRMARGFQNSARFVVNAIGAVGIFLAYAALPVGIVCGIVFLFVKFNKKAKARRQARKERRLAKKAEKQAAREAKKQIQKE